MKTMPFSEDAEKALLCSIVLKPTILDEASIPEWLFYIPAHQIIFRHLVEVYTEKETLDFVMVKASFNSQELDEIGGVQNLSAIYGYIPTSASWRHFHDLLTNRLIRRIIKSTCALLDQKMDEDDAEPAAVIREIGEKALTAMMTRSAQLSEIYFKEHIQLEKEELTNGEVPSYIEPTGIRALNLAVGGLLPGDQLIIAAQTSLGKTTLALNIAAHAAFGSQKKKVAIFSFEMSIPDIRKRIIASCSEVPLQAMRYREITAEHLRRIETFESKVEKGRTICLQEGYSLNITEIVSRCRRLKATEGLDIVVVDYLQLVNPTLTRESNRQREIADISRRLKVMAGELGVVVIALSQLNDDGKLRESRAIGQDADIVLMIQDGESDNVFEKTIFIEKSRNGPRGAKVPVHFYGDYVKFTDKA